MSHHHHEHHHHHDHRLQPGTTNEVRQKNILFAAILNVAFTLIELVGGLLTNSAAVLADAIHDLGDSLALFGAYVAERYATKSPDTKRTFGYARMSLISALISAVMLLVGSLFILFEGITRLFTPEPVATVWVGVLAVFGIVINYVAHAKLSHGQSITEAVLSWHLLEDVLGWVAVLVGAVLMYVTGWYVIDALLTIGFTIYIVWGVVHNLKEVVNVILEGVPSRVILADVKTAITTIPEVLSVHDMHVWSLDGAQLIVTGHVVVSRESFLRRQEIYAAIKLALAPFTVTHTTIAFEEQDEECLDSCD